MRQQSNATEIKQAIRDARDAAREAAQDARQAAQDARDAARAPDAPAPPDAPVRVSGITFDDRDGPVTVDFQNGNLILHQGTHTTAIPWREAVPKGAVQIAWAIPATLSILVIWWPLTRALTGWLRRKTAVAHDTSALEARVRERFEALERNVDTVAIEMERLSEGQRFTNKLLSERQAVPVESSRP